MNLSTSRVSDPFNPQQNNILKHQVTNLVLPSEGHTKQIQTFGFIVVRINHRQGQGTS